MKFKVVSEFENALLERRQFNVEISDFKATPNRNEVTSQFAAKMGLNPQTLVVDTYETVSGTNMAKAYIKSYKTLDVLKRVELKNNLKNWEKVNESPKKDESA